MFSITGIWLFAIINIVNCDLDLPSNFPKCYKDDPNLNQCLLKATDEMKPYLVAGVPELNMPSISSLHLPELSFEHDTGTMSFKVKITDALATGYDTYKFSQFDFVDMNKFVFKYALKYVDLEGDVELAGSILKLPIELKGHLSVNLTDVHPHGTIYLEEIVKNDVKYFKVKNVDIDVEVKDVQVDIGKLFGGDGIIGKAAHSVINDNKKLFLNDFSHTLNSIVEKATERQVYNEIFQVPIHKLFPEK